MKLCISTLVCPSWDLPRIIDTVAASKLQGIDFRGLGGEIDITRLPQFNEQLDETLSALRSRGLSMPCLNSSITLVCPDPDRWQTMLEECQRYATLAGKTGTRHLRIFGGHIPPGWSRAHARMLAGRHLRQIIKICKTHACQPLLETHDDWAASSHVLELFDNLTPDEVGVLWDIEHPYRQGEPIDDTVVALHSYLRHVHIKDSVREDDRNKPKLLGAGELPLRQAHRALRQAGYDGWICLETEKRWHPDAPEPEESIPQFAAYMASL